MISRILGKIRITFTMLQCPLESLGKLCLKKKGNITEQKKAL
jgi:hypothetical protein